MKHQSRNLMTGHTERDELPWPALDVVNYADTSTATYMFRSAVACFNTTADGTHNER